VKELNEEEINLIIKKVVSEFSKVVEERLVKTLMPQIKEELKPISRKEIAELEKSLNEATFVINEINKSFIGWFALRIVSKKINKKEKNKNDK